jgi:formylglycine-generating enzyme
MHRPYAALALFVAWWSALACSGAPFIGVEPTDLEASAGSRDEPSTTNEGGAPSGGRIGIASRPPRSGDGGASGGAADEGATSSAGAGGASETPSEPGGGSGGCPSLAGAKLVLADGFCIDQTEVTVAQYRDFLGRSPSLLDQPAACAGNATFANNCKATVPEKEPQRCVDWCDAWAYCASVGKRLCGATEGGSVAFDAPSDDAQDQWYSACSRGGERAYPYGDEYEPSACWGGDNPGTGVLTVGSASGCEGSYDGLSDMSGGLAEWVDSCEADGGPTDACRIRGGSSSGSSEQLRCDAVTATDRSTTSSYIGFRCCADLAR